jgi:hypothetical protein
MINIFGHFGANPAGRRVAAPASAVPTPAFKNVLRFSEDEDIVFLPVVEDGLSNLAGGPFKPSVGLRRASFNSKLVS